MHAASLLQVAWCFCMTELDPTDPLAIAMEAVAQRKKRGAAKEKTEEANALSAHPAQVLETPAMPGGSVEHPVSMRDRLRQILQRIVIVKSCVQLLEGTRGSCADAGRQDRRTSDQGTASGAKCDPQIVEASAKGCHRSTTTHQPSPCGDWQQKRRQQQTHQQQTQLKSTWPGRQDRRRGQKLDDHALKTQRPVEKAMMTQNNRAMTTKNNQATTTQNNRATMTKNNQATTTQNNWATMTETNQATTIQNNRADVSHESTSLYSMWLACVSIGASCDSCDVASDTPSTSPGVLSTVLQVTVANA